MSFLLLAGLLLRIADMAPAHDTLGRCVQHTIRLSVGAQNLDLTLDLTFFEEWSARERAAMDADGNGTVSRSEQEAYIKRMAPLVCKQVRLRVAGREVPLALLYDPELDLLTETKVAPAHHRLRLFLFAATPVNLRACDEILVEDRLWPEAKPLVTAQAEGHDACLVTPGPPTDPALKAPVNDSRLVRFGCIGVPGEKPVK